MNKSERELIARLEAELLTMRAELETLPADDLRAMFLRDGIRSTTYLIALEREHAAEPKRDMRFNARNAPLRKTQR